MIEVELGARFRNGIWNRVRVRVRVWADLFVDFWHMSIFRMGALDTLAGDQETGRSLYLVSWALPDGRCSGVCPKVYFL